MAADTMRNRSEGHQMRPRVIWAGVVAALAGMVLVGVGMVRADTGLAWGGVAVTLAGLLVAWRAGILYDVHGGLSIAQEREQIAAGGTLTGLAPTDHVLDQAATRHAAVVATESRVAVSRSANAPMPPLYPAATLVMLVLGVWAFIAQFALEFSMTAVGEGTAMRETGFAVVTVLTALYLRHVGPSRVASTLALLWGALLLLAGLLAAHASGRAQVNEVVTGCGVVLCALGTFRR